MHCILAHRLLAYVLLESTRLTKEVDLTEMGRH
jgi:hypothetical protein